MMIEKLSLNTLKHRHRCYQDARLHLSQGSIALDYEDLDCHFNIVGDGGGGKVW